MYDLDFNMFNSVLQNRGKEEGVFARFYDKLVKTGNIQENGLPEFKQKTYIEIRTRNSSDSPNRLADDADIARFPREYNFYLAKKEKQKEGTPLSMFAFLTVQQLESCDLKGVFTVEALAGLTDEQAQSLGLTEERNIAVKFLEVSKDNGALARLEEENAKLKAQIATLEDEIKALKG